MEFKKLELKEENKGIKGIILSQHFRKTVLYILAGAIAGFGLFYVTEGRHMDALVFADYTQNILLGAFLGFFITNSPCARNKC
jgi:hypothetical protein